MLQTKEDLALAVLKHMRAAQRNLARGFCDPKNIENLVALENVLKLVVKFENTLLTELCDDLD